MISLVKFIFQLLIAKNPNETNLRRRWLQLTRHNKKFVEAISNCKNGPTDHDCKIIDYIRDIDDFEQRFDPFDEKTENEIEVNHEAWVRSDVESD